MIKDIHFGEEGRKEVLNGIDIVVNAVKTSLGAAGKTTLIGYGYDGLVATKDGVSIARAIMVANPLTNMGCSLAKEVSGKTVDDSGDGTTTAAILFQAIVHGGVEAINKGANSVELKKGIQKAVEMIVAHLKTLSKPIDNVETLIQIASISANNDETIGKLIAEAVDSVGKDGLVIVEDSKNHETFVDTIEGMKFDRGFASPTYITNREKNRCELENPLILVTDKKLSLVKEVLDFIQHVSSKHPGKPLLIICDNIEGEAQSFFVENKSRGVLNVCVVKAPEFGTNRTRTLEDIAILVGANFISDEKGMLVNKAQDKDLGRAEKVIVDKDSTLIVGGKGNSLSVDERCNSIRVAIEESKNETETTQLKTRLAKMQGKIAVLKVGAITPTEAKEKKDRIDDALCATRAANEEGFVVGGGMALMECSDIDLLVIPAGDQYEGACIVREALRAPFKQLLTNAGIEPAPVLKELAATEYGVGFNAKTEKVENLFDSGVIDPTKVVRCALENAASIAEIFLTTECVISDPTPKDLK
jgi:chaperonin GroEL